MWKWRIEPSKIVQSITLYGRYLEDLKTIQYFIMPQAYIDAPRAAVYFALDRETKMRSYIGRSANHSGYVPVGEEQFAGGTSDLKEAYDVNCDYTAVTGRRPLLGPNTWPEMPGFGEDVRAYYAHITGIDDSAEMLASASPAMSASW